MAASEGVGHVIDGYFRACGSRSAKLFRKDFRSLTVQTSAKNEIVSACADGQPRHGGLLHIVILFFAVNLISAGLFITLRNTPRFYRGIYIFYSHQFSETGALLAMRPLTRATSAHHV